MKSVVAAEAAALAAFRVTSLGDRAGAVVFSENAVAEIRPQAREAGVRRLLPEIVRQNGLLGADSPLAPDPGLLNDALARAARLANHDWLVVLVSDASGADARTVELVTRITAHNDFLIVFVHDPLEAELPAIGRAVVAEAGRCPRSPGCQRSAPTRRTPRSVQPQASTSSASPAGTSAS